MAICLPVRELCRARASNPAVWTGQLSVPPMDDYPRPEVPSADHCVNGNSCDNSREDTEPMSLGPITDSLCNLEQIMPWCAPVCSSVHQGGRTAGEALKTLGAYALSGTRAPKDPHEMKCTLSPKRPSVAVQG